MFLTSGGYFFWAGAGKGPDFLQCRFSIIRRHWHNFPQNDIIFKVTLKQHNDQIFEHNEPNPTPDTRQG